MGLLTRGKTQAVCKAGVHYLKELKMISAIFRKPTILVLAKEELQEAEKALLHAESQKEFASARVEAYKAQVRRLQHFIENRE